MQRQQSLGFLDDPEHRAPSARTLDAALAVLRRSLEEATVWKNELDLAAGERRALEASLGPAVETEPLSAKTVRRRARRVFRPPTRGSAVAWPGLRRDPVTGAQGRLDGVQILSRMNEPVRAVARGEVRAVAPLPQGGFEVIVAHPDGWVSVLSGLREVEAAEGARIDKGGVLGRVGRNLDGAPVLTFELWHRGAAVDPRIALGRALRGRPL